MTTNRRQARRYYAGYRSGLSLIEVVAGTALAGTLLVGVLLAMSAHAKQLRQIELGEAGLQLIDKMLSAWALRDFDNEDLPDIATNTQTSIWLNSASIQPAESAHRDLAIRLTSERLPELQLWQAERVRVEAISQQSGSVVAKVEIVRHAP